MSKPKLALIPSGYKSGKVYSILPNDASGDFDFTRQSIGTRVRKDGLIEEAKTVGSITNEILYSEEFNNTNWVKATSDSTPIPIVTENATISPTGKMTADRVQLTAPPNNSWAVVRQSNVNTGATSGSILQQTIYLKANGISQVGKKVDIYIYDFSNSTYKTIENYTLTNDWQRVEVEHTITGNTSTNLEYSFGKARNNVGGSLQSETATDFFVWGAMLNKGGLSNYIKTEGSKVTETVEIFTDAPRLDWLNSNCPSLLLEPQRTNLVYPNTNLSGYSINNGVKSDNVITSPDGENNGSLVQSNGGGTSVVYKTFSTSTNTSYNISVFLKKGNYNNIRLQEGFTSSQMVVDLSNGTEVSSQNATNKKIEDYGNGWYRVSFNYTSHSSISLAQYSVYINGSTASGNTFYTFGGQIEQGSYLTSYMKTEASAVTRLKDECINSGDSDLFDITEGTFFVDTTPFTREATDRITLSNNNYNNRILISKSSSTQLQFIVVSNNSTVATYTTNVNYNERNKIAITFKQNEFKFYLNGSLVHTDTSGSVPTGLNDLSFKGIGSALYWNGKIHDTRVYDRVLTEAEAIELTK